MSATDLTLLLFERERASTESLPANLPVRPGSTEHRNLEYASKPPISKREKKGDGVPPFQPRRGNGVGFSERLETPPNLHHDHVSTVLLQHRMPIGKNMVDAK